MMFQTGICAHFMRSCHGHLVRITSQSASVPAVMLGNVQPKCQTRFSSTCAHTAICMPSSSRNSSSKCHEFNTETSSRTAMDDSNKRYFTTLLNRIRQDTRNTPGTSLHSKDINQACTISDVPLGDMTEKTSHRSVIGEYDEPLEKAAATDFDTSVKETSQRFCIESGQQIYTSSSENPEELDEDDDDLVDIPPPLSNIVPKFLDDIAPVLDPTFNFAAYVNRSESLQQLVKLGVDLSKVEKKIWFEKDGKRKSAVELLLSLDFEKHMKGHIQFLHDVGVPADQLGHYLTVNPFIFKESLEDLQVRIEYLRAKRFGDEAIARIVQKAPNFLMFSTVEIDNRLGYFQRLFSLSGQQVRNLVTKMPKLIITKLQHIREMTFTVKEEMGFTPEETRLLLLKLPKLWTLQRKNLEIRFQLVHNEIGISHERILDYPGILLRRKHLLMQRHLYLKKLRRAQYDPKQPNYVPLEDLVAGTDADFCARVAKTSVDDFNEFLKMM